MKEAKAELDVLRKMNEKAVTSSEEQRVSNDSYPFCRRCKCLTHTRINICVNTSRMESTIRNVWIAYRYAIGEYDFCTYNVMNSEPDGTSISKD